MSFAQAPSAAPQLGVAPIDEVVKAMTLDEKIDLIVGSAGNQAFSMSATIGGQAQIVAGASGQSNGIPRLGIPTTVFSDGPAGLRIDPKREGSDATFYCTHFPVGTVMSSTQPNLGAIGGQGHGRRGVALRC